MNGEDILIYDIETDGLDTTTANLKWFGAYSYLDNEYYLLPFTKKQEIQTLLRRHSKLVGFNILEFDNPIAERFSGIQLNFKNNIDLLPIAKKRLPSMGIDIKNFKLKTICDELKLSESSKGDIDYKIFMKEEWTLQEQIEIKIYLKQDIILAKALFEWFSNQFEPLRQMLPINEQLKYTHIKASIPSLGYQIMCHKAGLPVIWSDIVEEKTEEDQFGGGHFIIPRFTQIRGNIVCLDVDSFYPHCILSGNLFSHKEGGWNGKPYFNNLKGSYDTSCQGKVETPFKQILLERLEAKRTGDKIKANSYKLVVNSLYGATGNKKFKSLYNPKTAGDCTAMAATIMRNLAKKIELEGFKILYGFTDSLYILIPEKSNKEELMFIVDSFLKDLRQYVPFPQDTLKLKLEKEIKFCWFVTKNCYLWIDNKNKLEYKSTLLNSRTPKLIMNLFNEYMSVKIKENFCVDFTEEELIKQLRLKIKDNLSLACEEHKVKPITEYKSKTSLEYQISSKYGDGFHLLIPNIKRIGVGMEKSTKKKAGTRYCTIEEFESNNLKIEDVDFSKLIAHVKRFIGVKNDF
jgi:DNA polymerase elongation subunit (family B)